MAEKRKMASIQKIEKLSSIPNADKIELAKVLGWQCIVKKGEFKIGDKCVYFEVDSHLKSEPPWAEFLRKTKFRVKTIKLRGQISQGLAMPLSILPDTNKKYEIGEDVSEILEVTKYEIPIKQQAVTAADIEAPFPGWLTKTDSWRLKSFPHVFEELFDQNIHASTKIDGTSVSIFLKDGKFGVCSRNRQIKDGDNCYWEIAKKYKIEEKLRNLGKDIAIQGEVYGPKIQKNTSGVSELSVAIFDIFDIKKGRYLSFDEFVETAKNLDLPMVELIFCGKLKNFGSSIEDLQEIANKQKYSTNNRAAEGIVVKPVDATYEIKALKSKMQNSVKLLNENYLLKHE